MITCIEFLSLHSHCNGCIFNMELASLGMLGVNVIYDSFFLQYAMEFKKYLYIELLIHNYWYLSDTLIILIHVPGSF